MTTPFQKCRKCGCHDAHACETRLGPCFWVEENFCSACCVAQEKPTEQQITIVNAVLAKAAPDLFFQMNLWALRDLLIQKGMLKEAEIQTAVFREFRKASEPVEAAGSIIIPGR